MNFNSPTAWLQTSSLGIFALASVLSLGGCGGSASHTAIQDTSPAPLASAIEGEALVPVKDSSSSSAQGQSSAGAAPKPPLTAGSLPHVVVSDRQFSDPNVLLKLRGTVTAAAGATIAKTLWTQVTGPQVRISSPLDVENTILIPDVDVATSLEFRLTAQDSQGRINSATTSILVKPVPTFVKVIGGVFNEADEKATFTLRLNAPSSVPLTIDYVTQDGTAKSQSDYVATSGQVVLDPGQTMKQISVPIINDTIAENDESFSLQVTAIDGQTAHANSGVAIIHNGKEPQLQQTIKFLQHGTLKIYIDQPAFTNLLDPAVIALGTGSIIYSSANPLIASVDAQGLITPLTPGTTDISVTKLADNDYLDASDSFTLQVLSRGTPPSVQIDQQDGYTLKPGEIAHLSAYATDVEDGRLPTQQQIADSAASGKPITSFKWTSARDGLLGYGNKLDISTLTPGAQDITCSVTDSDNNISSKTIHILVASNIAPLATAKASSTYCVSEDCYSPNKINDGDPSTLLGNQYSWVNLNTDTAPWISLSWRSPVVIDRIDLYSTQGYVMQDYLIEYFDGANSWIPVVNITGNTQVHRSHDIPQITTLQLRVSVKKGSVEQPVYGRINELVVLGAVLPTNSANEASSIASSNESSSIASSAALSSSSASSSAVSSLSSIATASSANNSSSSAAKSSIKSSSAASSTAISSSSASFTSFASASSFSFETGTLVR